MGREKNIIIIINQYYVKERILEI